VNYGTVKGGAKKPETVILTNDQNTALAISSITMGGTDRATSVKNLPAEQAPRQAGTAPSR
jgi:hypothetical protein